MTDLGTEDFLRQHAGDLRPGPVALIFVEDLIEVGTTLRHALRAGFSEVLVFAHDITPIDADIADRVRRIRLDTRAPGAVAGAVNKVIAALPGRWIYYGYNAEYLFFPFCETRSVGEMLRFVDEERRDSVLTYVVDLYTEAAPDTDAPYPLEDAQLDRSGYYALARKSADGQPKERQLDFYGGLRWRFEEHLPAPARRIDRVALFRSRDGLRLLEDHRFNDEEYNTYACAWHNNLTAAICSFRVAKALRSNPGSRSHTDGLMWRNSTAFEWHSEQLMDLGLMEPGQWF